MTAQLTWLSTDLFVEDHLATTSLIWEHDGNVINIVSLSLDDLKNYVQLVGDVIRDAGFRQHEERAACFALLSLVPHFNGPLDPIRSSCITHLFEVSSNYLDTTNDLVTTDNGSTAPLRAVIIGSLYRALVDDAENQMEREEWAIKAAFYLQFCSLKIGSKEDVWLEAWFPELGWLGPMAGSVDTGLGFDSSIVGITRPDLATFLCIFNCEDYAEILVLGEYSLMGMILYSFHLMFWGQGKSKVVNLKPLLRLCSQANQIREEKILNPVFDPSAENLGIVSTDTDEQDVWVPGDDDTQILQGLLRMAHEKSGTEDDMIAIQEAIKYLNNFPSAINLGN